MKLKSYQIEFPWLVAGCHLNVLYDSAILFTREPGAEAICKRYFEALILYTQKSDPNLSVTQAERIIRDNIGYWAAYHNQSDREAVIKYYQAHHPILPLICSTEEAFELGKQMAERIDIEQSMREEVNKVKIRPKKT